MTRELPRLILIGLFLSVSTTFFGQEIFSGLANAEHLYGEKVNNEDLKGKVVFLEYWGVACPPCRASFPHLIKLQEKYGPSGKFTVLASHLQRNPEQAKNFCEEQKVNFPVFNQFIEPQARPAKGIPNAALIDHNGEVVKTGHPNDLYRLVKDLVKKVPDPLPEILGDVEVKIWKKQAKDLGDGKPLISILKTLKKAAKTDTPKGKEAKALVKVVERYVERKNEAYMAMAEEKPAEALKNLKAFLFQVKGMKMERELQKISQKLALDPAIRQLTTILNEIDKLKAQLAKKSSRGRLKKLEAQKEKLKKLAENNNINPAVASEAAEKLKEME